MMEATPSSQQWSAADQERIREQLNRMLGSNLFKQSRRYPALLRFIVEETLQGRGDLLKERVLGIEVLGRDPSYDTAADPVVRVTIAEIRKRIAQYYHDELRDAEIRIELPAGHYIAEFRPSKAATQAQSQEESRVLAPELVSPAVEYRGVVDVPASGIPGSVAVSAATTSPEVSLPRLSWLPFWKRKALLGVTFVLVLAGLACIGYRWRNPPALEELWAPLLQPSKQVLFCLPTDVGRHRGALTTPGDLSANDTRGASNGGTPSSLDDTARPGRASGRRTVVTFLDHETAGENVVFSDAVATVRIANLLTLHPQEFRIKLNVATALDDLRQGPAVLIGGLDNQWSLQAIEALPFRFAGSDDEGYWISNVRHPEDRRWSLDLKQEYAKVTRDYALIARVHSRQAGQVQMIVAGIGMSGTMAAGEFIVDRLQTEELRRRIGPGLRDRDFEAVLSTDVVNGVAGAPRILEVWVQ